MTDRASTAHRPPVVLGPGEGRAYPMGRVSAVFKADGAETEGGYSISEWWLDPHTKGPGAHSHPEDDVFYIVAGTMSVLVGTEWIEASTGSFVLVPGNVTHDVREPRLGACRDAQRLGPRRLRAAHAGHRAVVQRAFSRRLARLSRDARACRCPSSQVKDSGPKPPHATKPAMARKVRFNPAGTVS